jgi:hypothetical protein
MNSRLGAGLAVAASVQGVTITGTVKAVASVWELPIVIDANIESSLVARVSPWIVKIDRNYPYGSIAVFPATNGVTATFQHQEVNSEGAGSCRTGKLCLDNPYRNRTLATGCDPIGDADFRLAWHLTRAREWVTRAAAGDLVNDRDPFEIPRIEHRSRTSVRVIHDESNSSMSTWHPYEGQFGQVHFRSTPVPNTVVANKFTAYDRDRSVVRTSSLFLGGQPTRDVHGVWWLWPKPIVLAPWQAAVNWGELAAVGVDQGVDVFAALEQIANAVREANKVNKGWMLLMLGYPIPKQIGGPDVEVHWEAVSLPALTIAPPKGYRPKRKFWWLRDRQQHFGDKRKMAFVDTNNWHTDRVQARGRLPESVYRSTVAIVGCGALGSAVAELLVRGGLLELLLVDGEVLEVGNLSRHVLTSTSVGRGKADELAKRLRQISPSAKINIVPHDLRDPQMTHDRLDDADLTLDFTGADEVPSLMAATHWNIARRFISASFGYGAQRLFLFRSVGTKFPVNDFNAAVAPWLERERRVWSEAGEVLEGAGCYSPLFPARADDVMGGAVAVVKFIEDTIQARRDDAELVVLQSSRYGGFQPVNDVEDVEVRAA